MLLENRHSTTGIKCFEKKRSKITKLERLFFGKMTHDPEISFWIKSRNIFRKVEIFLEKFKFFRKTQDAFRKKKTIFG